MEAQFSCEECGGIECYLESGFYYCVECHTQARGLRETIFESQETAGGAAGTRLTKQKKKEKKADKISTFETYNYILLGLVNELVAAGASKDLKPIVKQLWFKYLEKLEVIRDGLPKLPAIHSKIDEEIFYQRKRKKRQRTNSGSSSSDETVSSRRDRSKRKRDFIKADYEQELSQDAVSITNQSLTSLKTLSESASEKSTRVLFNFGARKLLLKQQSRYHLARHCKDEHMEMNCHMPTSRSLGTVYKHSPYMLSRHKLYCLIYLGLLITKDKIQLGDLLRFIREGHLSFNSVTHFFPEEINLKNVDLSKYLARRMLLTHCSTRQTTAEMAKFLRITHEIPIQNLVDLCERYCRELNLPDEVFKYALKIMSNAVPVMTTNKRSSFIPKYEARAMAFIMFTMKLLFGLDDKTEHKFSNYATVVNNINEDSALNLRIMFVFDDWMKHIQYRKCVLKRYHFPTCFLLDDHTVRDIDLFANFLGENREKQEGDDEVSLRKEFEVYKQVLSDLTDLDADLQESKLKFRLSFTPFYDYTNLVLKSHPKDSFLPSLSHKFSETSLDFLLRPNTYLKLINGNEPVKIRQQGANRQMKFSTIKNMKNEQRVERERRRRWVTVRIGDDVDLHGENREQAADGDDELDCAKIMKQHKFDLESRQKGKKRKKPSDEKEFPQKHVIHREEDCYNKHYEPHMTYWLSIRMLGRCGGEEGFQNYLDQLPHSFVLLLEECARILEMHRKQLLEEFMNVELYLCYVAKFTRFAVKKPVLDKQLKRLIQKAKDLW